MRSRLTTPHPDAPCKQPGAAPPRPACDPLTATTALARGLLVLEPTSTVALRSSAALPAVTTTDATCRQG